MQITFKNAQGMCVNTSGQTVMEFDDSSQLSIKTGSFDALAKLTDIDPIEAMEYALDCDDEELERIINAIGKDAFINRVLHVTKLRRVA